MLNSLLGSVKQQELRSWARRIHVCMCRLTWPCAGVSSVEAAGLRLAVMTTLVRLLEVKLAELEGEGGTGSLEDDVQLLEGPLSSPGILINLHEHILHFL